MLSRPPRRLTIADVMILTVAAALSLACWRAYVLSNESLVGRSAPGILRVYYHAMGGVYLLTPPSLTLLAFGLKGSPRRRLASEPSVVVGITTALVLVVNVLWFVATISIKGRVFYNLNALLLYWHHSQAVIDQTGTAIGAACLVRVVSGLNRRPRDWVDVASLAMGIGWISLLLVSKATALFL